MIPSPARSRSSAAPPGPEVLIVDDDPDVLFTLAARFRAAGFRPILATDGEDALSRMAEHPDCRRMLTDYCMPGLAGAAWVEELGRRCPHWSIVVMSVTDADPGHFVIAPKPLDMENLLQHFRRVQPPTLDEVAPRRRAAG